MVNWHEVPFVRVLIPFILGIFLSIHIDVKIPSGDLILSVLALATILFALKRQSFRHRWLFGFIATCTFAIFGYQLTYHHASQRSEQFIGQYFQDRQELIIGAVNNQPVYKDRIKIELKTQFLVADDGQTQPCEGKMLVYFEMDSVGAFLQYGDVVLFKSKPFEIEPPKNPHAFDYRRYLRFQNIRHQAFVKSGDYTVIDRNKGNWITAKALQLRQKFLNILRKHLTGENEFAVGSALIIGYQDEISQEVRNAYAATGAIHVLSVSGLHVGMVFLIIEFLLGRFKSRNRYWLFFKLLASIFGIWIFALVTGGSAPVLRAATMFSFVIVGSYLKRYTNIYNSLAASAFILLLTDPYLLMQIGFQLSYLAIVGIAFFQPIIYKWWIIENKIGDHLWQLTAVSFAAQITTLPVSIFYFNQIPMYFWLSGFVVVDAAFVILALGILLFLTEAILPFLANIFGYCIHGLVWIVNSIIFGIQQLPGNLIEGIWLSSFSLLLLFLMLIGIAGLINSGNDKVLWIRFLSAMLLLFSLNVAFQNYQDYRTKEVVVYHTNKQSIADFANNGRVISITNRELAPKTLYYAVNQHRCARGLKELASIHFEDTAKVKFDHFFRNHHFVSFQNKTFAFVDKGGLKTQHPLKVNFVVLRNNPKTSIRKLQETIQFDTLIVDGSNHNWNARRWEKECAELNIPVHNGKKKGAFVFRWD